MAKKIKGFSEISLLAGLIFCSLGVCFASKSGFGVSMVVAPAKVLSEYFSWMTLGWGETLVQVALLIIVSIIVKKVKIKYILSFLTAFVYGRMLDFWLFVFGKEQYTDMTSRILSCSASLLLVSFAVACYLRSYLPQPGYEMIVSELANHYKKDMNKVKWIYDISSLAAAIILMLTLFFKFDFTMVGIATLIATFINAPLIAMWGKLMETKLEFTPKFTKFKEWYDKILD